MPVVFDIRDGEEDNIEIIPDWHLAVLKERLDNIDNTLLIDSTEFIQSLKKLER